MVSWREAWSSEVWGTARRVAIDFSLGEFSTDTVVAALIPLFHLSLPSIFLSFSSLSIYLFFLDIVSLFLAVSHLTQAHLPASDLERLLHRVCFLEPNSLSFVTRA